jgi:hypothetical protein
LAFGEPYVNTDLGTLQIGGPTGDITLGSTGTGSTGNFGPISGSGLDITGNANIGGNLTVGGQLQIGDATSDTVNVVASLSSSLIPQTTNVFDLGSATKIWRDLYISTGSIKFVAGTTVVKELSLATITGLESSTGSSNVSITNLNTTTASLLIETANLETFSSSALTRLAALEVETSNLETFSGSQLGKDSTLATYTGSVESRFSTLATLTGSNATRLTNLETTTASLNTSVSNLNTYTGSNDTKWSTLGSLSGSFARTNSTNTFNGNQTISGSLTVTQNLVILGSSSIQNVSSSTLNIGTNLITVAVNQPSVRFGGIAVIDSGSAGASGSFLYDSVQDEFIFVHRGNGTNVTSSHFVLGPETYDNLGNETYLTNNRLPKGTGKEHLVDSNISDDGTTVNITGALTVTGNITGPIRATNGLVSGSSQITLQSTTGFTAYDTALATITGSLILSASNDASKFTTLATTTGSINTSLSNLNTFSGSALTRLTALEVETSNLESFTSSINTTIKTRLNAETVVSGSGQINVASTTGDIALGTRTSGNYVATITAGTGVSSTGATTGEGIAHTISIGQAVATTDNVRFASIGVGMAASGTAGRIDAANDIVAFSTSDIRLKENITPIPNAIEKIRKISGNTYDWKAELKDVHGYEGNDVGVIAQEVEAVLPQLVQDRDNGYKAVKYDKLVALLIEGIKEQQQHIDNLTIQVEELKKQKGL